MEQLPLQALEAEDRKLYAMLRANQARRHELQVQLEDEMRMAAQRRRDEVAAKANELKGKRPLGIEYAKLRTSIAGRGLRVVYVHPEVRGLLVQALPAESEEQFLQLMSTLVERLASSHKYVKPVVEALKADDSVNYYFQAGDDERVSVTIALNNKYADGSSEYYSDVVTAYAIEYRKCSGQKLTEEGE